MVKKFKVSTILMVLIFTACNEKPHIGLLHGEIPAWTPRNNLPAFQTEAEKKILQKGDANSDFKDSHPEWYGNTAPPGHQVRLFAEYEPVSILLLSPGDSVNKFYKTIIGAAAGHIDEIILVVEDGELAKLKDPLEDNGLNPTQFDYFNNGQMNSIWMRDYGPQSVLTGDGSLGLIDMRYYPWRIHDDRIPTTLGAKLGLNVFRPSFVFEGAT